MLREFAPNLEVVVGNGKKELTVIPLPELLPHSFGPESLG
jgi:cytidine deaminase